MTLHPFIEITDEVGFALKLVSVVVIFKGITPV